MIVTFLSILACGDKSSDTSTTADDTSTTVDTSDTIDPCAPIEGLDGTWNVQVVSSLKMELRLKEMFVYKCAIPKLALFLNGLKLDFAFRKGHFPQY